MFLFARPRTIAHLGNGISGSVDLVHSAGTVCAVKHYHDREPYESRADFRERALREYNILVSLEHPNVIRALRLEVGWGGQVKMHMEAGSANLAVLLRGQPKAGPAQLATGAVLPELRCLWRQLLLAVQYLHDQNWCHRDIKLENLVVVGRTLKMVDFATAARCDSSAAGLVGSPRYAAPETSASIRYQGAPADMWAVAIVLVFFGAARFPWKGAVWSDAAYASYAQDGRSAVIARLEPGAARAAARALVPDPQHRAAVKELLAQEWVGALEWCRGETRCGALHTLGGSICEQSI